jgi:hypothetical protein
MHTGLIWAAAALSALTFAVHTFVGGKFVARPLLADRSLPAASKWLNYYCWHITTLLLVAMTVGYIHAARTGAGVELVIFMGVCSAAFSVLSGAVAIKGGINPFRFPSTSLFASVALMTGLGFVF